MVEGIGSGVVDAVDSPGGTDVVDTEGTNDPGIAPSSSPPEATITHTMTPTRNTNTTPMTAGRLTFHRSPGPDCPPFHWSAIPRFSQLACRDVGGASTAVLLAELGGDRGVDRLLRDPAVDSRPG